MPRSKSHCVGRTCMDMTRRRSEATKRKRGREKGEIKGESLTAPLVIGC